MNIINRKIEIEKKSKKIEQIVLACMIIEPKILAKGITVIEEEMFYYTEHQILFILLVNLFNRGMKPELTIIVNELIKIDRLQDVGGAVYINELINSTPTSANFQYYLTELRSYYTARKMESIMLNGIEQLDKGETENLITEMTTQMRELEQYSESKTLTRLQEYAHEFIDWYDTCYKEDSMLTGLSKYDEILGGIKKQDLTVIAARPGTGKTALALNIAHNISKEHKHITFFSMEMTAIQIYSRLISSILGIDNRRIQNQTLNGYEVEQIMQGMDKINNNNIFIDDSSTQTIEQIEMKIRRMKQEHGCDIVFIDYLQKIYDPNERKTENEKLSKTIQTLKRLAKELNISVIAIAQLNRGSEYRQNKEPVASDIRGSGVIEQEADNIILLHRPDLYTEDKGRGNPASNVVCIIDKHRNGETGRFNLCFTKPLLKFSDW